MALLGGVFLLTFADVLFLGNCFHHRDLSSFHYPNKLIVRESILNGEFPYWNPRYAAGQPMAANPNYGVFYPPQWLTLIPDYYLGFRLHILIHLLIAGSGFYALLRSIGLRSTACLFGALSGMLGGVTLSLVNLLTLLFVTCWVPWIFLYARRFLLERNVRDLGLASIFFGLQMLAGEPMTIAQTTLLLFVLAVVESRTTNARDRRLPLLLSLSILVVAGGLLIGAVQVFPAIDHAGDSARSRPFSYESVTYWSLPPIRFLELIYPDVMGPLADKPGLYWGAERYPGSESPFLQSIYPGLFASVLVVAGLVRRIPGYGWFVLVGSVWWLLALGSHVPLFRLLYAAGVRSVRYPEKFAIAAIFLMIVYAAWALDRMLTDSRLHRAALGSAMVFTLVAAAIAMFAFLPGYGDLFVRFWGVEPGGSGRVMARIAAQGWFVAVLRGAVLCILLGLMNRLRRNLWLALMMGFVTIDLAAQANKYLPRMPERFFKPAESVADRPQTPRLFHQAQWLTDSSHWRLYALTAGADVYWLYRNGLFPMTTVTRGFHLVLEQDIDATTLLPTADLLTVLQVLAQTGGPDAIRPLLDMSNVSSVAVLRPFQETREQVERDVENANPILMVPYQGNSRYYFADELVQIRSLSDFVSHLNSNSWQQRRAFVNFSPFEPRPGMVRSVGERNNRVVLEAESSGRALLVIAVTPHKYWRATLNGRPIDLVAVNIGYQGVVVPGGSHRLEMVYANPLIPLAGAVSLLSLALAAFAATRPRSRHDPDRA